MRQCANVYMCALLSCHMPTVTVTVSDLIKAMEMSPLVWIQQLEKIMVHYDTHGEPPHVIASDKCRSSLFHGINALFCACARVKQHCQDWASRHWQLPPIPSSSYWSLYEQRKFKQLLNSLESMFTVLEFGPGHYKLAASVFGNEITPFKVIDEINSLRGSHLRFCQ
jgi:hypothetical protein